MSKLKQLEEEISKIKNEIIDLESPLSTIFSQTAFNYRPELNAKLNKLETERQFILDHRESWLPKTIWNIIVPIIISVSIAILGKYLIK